MLCEDIRGAPRERLFPMGFSQDGRSPRLAQTLHDTFARAVPFPHVVMDDFLPNEVCERLIEQFPAPGTIDWQRIDSKDQKKLAATREALFSDYLCAVLREFNGPAALQFLETLTGIAALIPAP